MNRKRDKILQSPSTLRIRLSRHLAFSYLTQAAFYMVLVIAWLYWYVTYIWNRIGPDSGGRIELPRIVLFMIGFGLPVAIWFLYTVFFIQRPLRYLDDLLAATEQLASDKEQPIVLPEVMKGAENELNEVRLQAILDERTLLEQEEKKNDLIMYLAHDLKTPLTSVMGYLALLEENPDLSPEQRARYIGIARAKAERLEELIGEFFDITRLTLTTMTLSRSQISLSRMLEQVVSPPGGEGASLESGYSARRLYERRCGQTAEGVRQSDPQRGQLLLSGYGAGDADASDGQPRFRPHPDQPPQQWADHSQRKAAQALRSVLPP